MAREDIALALKIARERAGMTCKQVGQLLNKSDKTISAWEHCNGQPDADTFIKLCDIYQVPSIDELLGHSSGTTFLADELDLIRRFRKLTVNSKQIVSTLVNLELRHIEANKQGETPIKVIRKEKADAIVKAAILKNDKTVRKMPEHEQEKYFLKVLSQPAAAGYGNYLDDGKVKFAKIA